MNYLQLSLDPTVGWFKCRMIQYEALTSHDQTVGWSNVGLSNVGLSNVEWSNQRVSYLFCFCPDVSKRGQGFAFRALTCLALPIDWQSLKKCFKFVGNYFVSFFPQRNIPNWQWNNPIHEIRFSNDKLNFYFTTFLWYRWTSNFSIILSFGFECETPKIVIIPHISKNYWVRLIYLRSNNSIKRLCMETLRRSGNLKYLIEPKTFCPHTSYHIIHSLRLRM